MDTRSLLLAALLSAAASTAPLAAAQSPDAKTPPRGALPEAEARERQRICSARTRAYPTWCREVERHEADAERERVRRREGAR